MVNDAVQRQDGLAGGLAVLDGGLCGRRAGMKRRRVRQGLKGEGYQADSQAGSQPDTNSITTQLLQLFRLLPQEQGQQLTSKYRSTM